MLTTAIGDGKHAAACRRRGAANNADRAHDQAVVPPVATPSVTDNLGAMLEGQVRVIADKASNKVIVMSSGRDYLAIKDVIRELDQPRRQVYIEAAILEVTVDNDTEMGTSSHGGTTTSNGNALVLGGVQTGQVSTLGLDQAASSTSTTPSPLATATGLITGIVGSPLSASTSILGTSIPSYAVLFQALATQSNTKVVSTPSIIALDNEEAKYQVGTNIPYNAGTSAALGVQTVNTQRASRHRARARHQAAHLGERQRAARGQAQRARS